VAARRDARPTFDRVPPQNIEAEQAVLGAMLLNRDAAGAAIQVLGQDPREIFYVEAHQRIYTSVVDLSKESTPVDEVTLFDRLKRDGHLEAAGGATYIAQLTDAVPTSANVEYYARIVRDAAILRNLITTCDRLSANAYAQEGEARDLLDEAESAIFTLAQTREVNQISEVGHLVNPAVERIQKLIELHTGISGLSTGYRELDKKLAGLQPSDMIVLAARPSVGKTALALNIARHVAIDEKKGALIFSLEMSKEQLTQRLLCMEGRINSDWLRAGFLAKEVMSKVSDAAGRMYEAPIYIDDTPNITILDVRSKSRRLMAQRQVSVIIIDYLQLMNAPVRRKNSENRQVEISEISRGIKGLARELHVPVVALSQLSREAEKDDRGVPKLSHLRESGSIEQDADVVLMLYRPPAHKRDEDEAGGGNDKLIKLNIAKQRNGPTGEIDLLFFKNFQRFENAASGAEAGEVDEAATAGYGADDYGDSDDESGGGAEYANSDEYPDGEDGVPF
jgi:replicative DNA helicase